MKLGCSYFGNRIIRYAKLDMEFLKKNDFDYVVHTFSENDLVFYKKTVSDIVKASKEIGLEVHVDPWGVGKVFGGEAFSDIININPKMKQILSDGDPGPIACLNNPEFRTFMNKWVDAAVETGTDYIFWDEPHFYLPSWIGGRPNTWGCRCNYCKEKYKAEYNEEMPMVETEQVVQFKQNSIRDFLAEKIAYAKSKGVKNSLCSLPVEEKNEKFWDVLAAIDGLDNFGTDPYWVASKKDLNQYVGGHSTKVVELTKKLKKNTHIWIQGFGIPAGREDELRQAVEVVVNAGVKDIAVWGFDACNALSWIRPDNPEKCWQIILDAFKNAKKNS